MAQDNLGQYRGIFIVYQFDMHSGFNLNSAASEFYRLRTVFGFFPSIEHPASVVEVGNWTDLVPVRSFFNFIFQHLSNSPCFLIFSFLYLYV